MTIPNLITIFRFCLVPLAVWCIGAGAWGWAFVAFLVAGVSDGIDGYIAKRFDMRSKLGAVLDPLADKALLVSIFVTLGIVGVVPLWLVILAVFRDLMIIGAVLVSWVMEQPMTIAPSQLSKLNTATQIVFVVLVLFAKGTGWPFPFLIEAGSAIVAVLTIASAAAYLRQWLNHMAS
ncbi:CDP-diacylglycerol--glycerol-3-phosphate 3-phosphatidyltransferase [Labrys miyagiensis]|uniref:CDP-diacylglycerol--glycerol-3-phosphate 3-phosphatidyltransferase n=1 Tax=Labrys miyagiensis TaxID=346912 RepID=A0ABQ6CEA3_9HYPH|nr:CDP-alcohol phosphatidyltransferase family protein [Labrys miyagiensis]GLS18693.1 CDP-diacylglycerol--glycerol-3-phosphate 3-phosphatidyltransferase [Labrys miyagiensis]